MNPLLDRWLKSSLAKHFRTLCTTNSIKFSTEREFRDTGTLDEWVELRVIGPEFFELGNDEYRISLEIDLLVTVKPIKSDILRVDTVTGLLAANCENIPIYSSDDTNDFLFCLTLDSEIAQNVRVVPYGQSATIKQRRASVMAIYEVETTITV